MLRFNIINVNFWLILSNALDYQENTIPSPSFSSRKNPFKNIRYMAN